jgi:hypothetical protein
MDKEHKIFLEPEESLEEVIDKIKKGKGDKIVLHIPEGSVLRSSIDNFYAIKEKSFIEGKEILIESVDPYIEEIAERVGLDAINPIFGREEHFVSDIIPRRKKGILTSTSDYKKEGGVEKEKEDKAYNFFNAPKSKKILKEEKRKEKKERKAIQPVNRKKRSLVLAGTFTLLILLGFLAVNVLPKADVEVTLKKSPLSFEENIIASASVYEIALGEEEIIIPGELLTAVKNIEKKFPATGEEEIQKKATGELYIYNEYSSAPQTLVDTTRFVSSEGKVFRLDEKVTVPGAEIIGGEILPSKIKVSVTADKAGEEYNINSDSEEKWTIPGFKEAGLTDRYNKFYAKTASSMSGGYSGISKVPTEEDLEKAEAEIKEILKSSLESQIMIAYSDNFKSLEPARQFEITKIDFSERADDEGNFSIFAEGKTEAFVFEEKTLKEALIEKNSSPLDFDFQIIESKVNYSEAKTGENEESISFSINGSFVVEPKINKDNLKAQLIGQTEEMVKPILFSIPNLEKARITLWPFWVSKVPENPKKVNIELK